MQHDSEHVTILAHCQSLAAARALQNCHANVHAIIPAPTHCLGRWSCQASACTACRFVVKVVVVGEEGTNAGGCPHLLRDESLSLQLHVGHDQPSYYELMRVSLEKGAARGIVYLWCQRESECTLRVYLEGLPDQEPPW